MLRFLLSIGRGVINFILQPDPKHTARVKRSHFHKNKSCTLTTGAVFQGAKKMLLLSSPSVSSYEAEQTRKRSVKERPRLTGCRTVLSCRSWCCAAPAAPPCCFGAVWVSERSLWVPEWWTSNNPPAPIGGPGTPPNWHMHLWRGQTVHNAAYVVDQN